MCLFCRSNHFFGFIGHEHSRILFSPNNFPGLKKTLITVRSNPLPVDAYSLIPVDMNSNFQIIISSIDPTKYWFMFPVAIGVATCAITAGIGGAALFGPIFLIIFPLLGPQYAFESPATSVGNFLTVFSLLFLKKLTSFLVNVYERHRYFD